MENEILLKANEVLDMLKNLSLEEKQAVLSVAQIVINSTDLYLTSRE